MSVNTIKSDGSSARLRALSRLAGALVGVLPVLLSSTPVVARDTSPAPILQYFESTYGVIEKRIADVFKAGYGMMYTPPPGRADQGGFSVGFDQYDRFDLGYAGNPTLHGTEAGLRATVKTAHRAGLDFGVDLVLNHNGYSTLDTPGFYDAGGYPGVVITLPGDYDGDFNSGYDYGDLNGRLAGLIDIDHAKNYQFIRSPVDPNDSRNIRPGTTPAFGRLANVATESNRRFYPDRDGPAIFVFDPKTGEQNIPIYSFNASNPASGDAVPENVTGYLMRNAQWLVQSIGIDAFRLDATKHLEGFALDYFDRSVYRQSTRTLLDGSQKQVFSWGEAYTGDQAYLQTLVRNDINPADPGRVGGNRDTLDFPLFFALEANLSGNGLQNDWRNIKNASFDMHDDGLNNGSQGVKFAGSHDDHGPYLSTVAQAYTLMQPGNAIVYFNAKQFGTGRNFPKDGRGDALGGAYGDSITDLVDLRNRYGQGNYIERFASKESFAFEREGSSLVLLSNRGDNFYDNQTLNVNFPWGTRLIELTGNALRYGAPQMLEVFNDFFNGPGKVNVSFLPNNGGDHGYLIYGLASPVGSVTLGGVTQTIAGANADVNTGNNDSNAYNNAVTRVSDVRVLTGTSLSIGLNTSAVNLLGTFRDRNADGDNAVFKINEGMDFNGNGRVDFTTPGSVVYGFEEFTTQRSPGYFNADGNGSFVQNIDTSSLAEGYHYLTVRAFRHREDGGPAIYSDWKEVLYVDRFKPVSAIDTFNPYTFAPTNQENRDLIIRSTDQTADNVHVLMNLGAGLSDSEVLAMVNGSNKAGQTDRDLFKYGFNGVPNGNNAFTVVTYEMTGNVNVQRFAGYRTQTLVGGGLMDLTFDGSRQSNDIDSFRSVLNSNNRTFNPAADLDGDGRVDLEDVFLAGPELARNNVEVGTWNNFNALLNEPVVTTGTYAPKANRDVYEVTAGATVVGAGRSLTATHVRGNLLDLSAGSVVNLRANPTLGGTSKVASLLVGPGATLNLNNNALIVDHAGTDTTAYSIVRSQIIQARLGGTWSGTGIGSGSLASDPSLGIGYAKASDLFGTNGGTFRGLGTDGSAVLVRVTKLGDTDLNGTVNLVDFGKLRSRFGQAGDWTSGDFDYNGTVSLNDFGSLRANFGTSYGSTTAQGASSLFDSTSSIVASSASFNDFALTLLVDTQTGLVRLVGPDAPGTKVSGYQIDSAGGSIIGANWRSLADQSVGGFGEFVAGPNLLAEGSLSSFATVSGLGFGLDNGVNGLFQIGGAQDWVLFALDDQNNPVSVNVSYVPEPTGTVFLVISVASLLIRRRRVQTCSGQHLIFRPIAVVRV